MHTTPHMRRTFVVVQRLQELIAERPEVVQQFGQFPRDMSALIVYGLEIPIIMMRDLTAQDASKYLCALYGDARPDDRGMVNRRLYGLLHIGSPSNLIFVDETLPPHIVNYILAHELGHFLADVFIIQQLWHKTLPEQRAAIQRAFTWQESDAQLELLALLRGLPPRPATSIGRTRAMNAEAMEREIQADFIARELLAPWEVVAPYVKGSDQQELYAVLPGQFGLPKRIAWYYAQDLQRCTAPGPDMLDRLFAPLTRATEG